MRSQQFFVSILAVIVLLSITACRELTEEEMRVRNAERWERLPEATRMEHIRTANFARSFVFRCEDGHIASLTAIMQSGYRTFGFVLSEEEAKSGDNDTFYFWPTPGAENALRNLNEILEEEFDDWDTVSFSYPVTMEELIEHWEEIFDLGEGMGLFFPVNRILPSLWRMSPVEESETEDSVEPNNPIADEEYESEEEPEASAPIRDFGLM